MEDLLKNGGNNLVPDYGLHASEAGDEKAIFEIELLAEYLDRFSLVNTLEELVALSQEIFEKKLPSQYTGLYLWDEKEHRLRMMVATGFSEEERKEAERTAMDRHVGQVFRSGEPILIDDTFDPNADWSLDSERTFRVRTRLVMPVKSFDRTVGVFIIASLKANRFTQLEKSIFNVICKIAGYIYYRLDQLERSEAQNRRLADLALIATKTSNNVVIADRFGRIEWVNDAFVKQTGYSLEESLGKTPGTLLNNSDEPVEKRKALRQAIEEGRYIKTEVTNRTKDGRLYTNEIDITPIRDEEGKLLKFISVQKDVTERKRFLEELSKSSLQLQSINSRLETIARFSKIGIWEWDALNNTTFWSDMAFEVMGVKNNPAEDMFAFWQNLLHPDDREATLRQTYSLMEGKTQLQEFSYRVIDEEDKIRFIRGLTYMERDANGNNLRMVGSIVNVTKEVQASEILAASEAKYREMFNNNVAGVFRTTLSGQIIDVNRAFLKIFGYEKEELMQMGLGALYFSKEDRNAYLKELDAKQKLENYLLRTKNKTGEVVELLLNVQIVKTEGSEFLEGTLIDITEIRHAQQKIQSSEALFRGIFDTNIAGVFLKNKDGLIIDGNQAARQILGIEEQFQNTKPAFLSFVKDKEKWAEIRKAVNEGLNPGSFKLTIASANGSERNVLLTCNSVELEQFGSCLLFTIIDITETDRLNQQLADSEKRYRDLFENSLEIIQSFGPDGKLIFCNKKWFSTLEYQEEEVADLTLFDIIAPEDQAHCMALFEQVLQGKSIQNIDVTFLGKQGKRIELNGNVVPMMQNGKMVSTHSFFRDVSIENEQKKMLDSQRKFYERVLENLPSEISILDGEMRYLYSNPLTITGSLPRSQALGKTMFERSLQLGRSMDDAIGRVNKFLKAIDQRSVVTFEETLQSGGGGEKTILRQFFPVFNEHDELELMISVGTDVTELEEGRRKLSQNNEELLKVNHELDRFVYSVSHDLRAPIASVKGLLSLMADNEAGEAVKKTYLTMMNTVMEQMDNVIFEILDYSRNSRMEVQAEEIDVEEMIKASVDTYRHFSSKPVHLSMEKEVKSIFYSDNRRIQSVINNLISNAIKYSLKGPKEIELKIGIRVDEENLRLTVSDNGEGIRASYLPHIFDMFYRASNTSSGSGLGLYICREVLKKLDGTIEVESTEGVGTSFAIMVPNKPQNK